MNDVEKKKRDGKARKRKAQETQNSYIRGIKLLKYEK